MAVSQELVAPGTGRGVTLVLDSDPSVIQEVLKANWQDLAPHIHPISSGPVKLPPPWAIPDGFHSAMEGDHLATMVLHHFLHYGVRAVEGEPHDD